MRSIQARNAIFDEHLLLDILTDSGLGLVSASFDMAVFH